MIKMTNFKPKYDNKSKMKFGKTPKLNHDRKVLTGLKKKKQDELPLLTAFTPERAHCVRTMRDACGAFKELTKKMISWSNILL